MINPETFKNTIEPTVTGLGYELVEVTFGKQYGTDSLTVVIFKKGGMGLDDCEAVHNAISGLLDELDPTEASYNLNVSSMGLDWPIVTAEDFRRREGEEIEIFLNAAVDKKKVHVGTLIAADGDSIEIKNNKIYKLDRKNVAKVRPFVKF